jgi:ATP-dependent Lhr-like helicase
MTLSFAVNDYGMELLADRNLPPEEVLAEGLFSTENLTEDLQEAVNAAELARRHFREIARISGLVASRFPGRRKSAAQLQASSGLLFDVLNRYDPENRLLAQARFEVLETRLEHRRLAACLERIASSRCRITRPPRVTPLAFPIMVDRLRASISSEKLLERLQRLLDGLNRAADAAAPGKGAS